MNYKSRIEKMIISGALSQEQANQIQQSISGVQADYIKPSPHRSKLPTSLIALLGGGLLALIFIMVLAGSSASPDSDVVQNISETLNTVEEIGKMSESRQMTLLGIAIVGLPLLLCSITVMFLYNGLVSKEENVFSSWAQVESNLQRRVDLIPNLVTSIKSYMQHEKDVLGEVTRNRAGGLSEVVSALESLTKKGGELASLSGKAVEKLADDAFMKALAAEQQKIGTHVNKLMGVVESYPDLRSSDQFIALQAQLEGTENRINVTRMVFNDTVGEYNASIRKIPASFVAGMGNFKRKAYFQADDSVKTKIEM